MNIHVGTYKGLRTTWTHIDVLKSMSRVVKSLNELLKEWVELYSLVLEILSGREIYCSKVVRK